MRSDPPRGTCHRACSGPGVAGVGPARGEGRGCPRPGKGWFLGPAGVGGKGRARGALPLSSAEKQIRPRCVSWKNHSHCLIFWGSGSDSLMP